MKRTISYICASAVLVLSATGVSYAGPPPSLPEPTMFMLIGALAGTGAAGAIYGIIRKRRK